MDKADKILREIQRQAADARKIAGKGDPAVFAPLIAELDAAKSPEATAGAARAILCAQLDALRLK